MYGAYLYVLVAKNHETILNPQELEIITNPELMQAKVSAISKIKDLLTVVREKLDQEICLSPPDILPVSKPGSGKISRGENYLGLPYVILDHPAVFGVEDIFAFRTMFWWGHFFSCTLHLQGSYWDRYKKSFINTGDYFNGDDVFLSSGHSPWHYHYGIDNYILLRQVDTAFLSSRPFLKISKKLNLEDYTLLPVFAINFFRQLAELLQKD